MEGIKDIVAQVIEELGSLHSDTLGQMEIAWGSIVDAKTKKHTRVRGWQQGVLYIDVDSPVWLYHMRLKKNQYQEEIRRHMAALTEIRFKIGKIS